MNRNYPQSRMWGWHLLPTRLDLRVSIGASGAPTIVNGLGIASITRLVAGTYQIQFQDNYAQFLTMDAIMLAPVSGSNVNDGSFSTGTVYEITAVGTTDWVSLGLPAGITPAVGQIFKATGAGGSGSGTAKILGVSGITDVEILGDPNTMLSNQPFVLGQGGGFITFHTLAPTSSSVTTAVATDPASGSTLILEIYMNRSQVQ